MAKAKIETIKIKTDLCGKILKLEEQKKILDKQIKELKLEVQELAPNSGSLKFEDLTGATATITIAESMKYSSQLTEICNAHKSIAKEYFKMEYKPICNKAIKRKIDSSTSPIWKEINDCITVSTTTKVAIKAAK